jgi:hypothetical protein
MEKGAGAEKTTTTEDKSEGKRNEESWRGLKEVRKKKRQPRKMEFYSLWKYQCGQSCTGSLA